MLIVAIGKLRGPQCDLFADYAKRLRPKLEWVEITAPHPVQQKTKEGEKLLAALPKNAFAIALDPRGKAYDSPGFALQLEQWEQGGQPLAFIIGGADGLSDAVLVRANARLSLGQLTWPHLLCRVMLAEQLYRAQQIRAGHPYHRA